MKENTISAVIIAKNEEQNLPNSINSLLPFCQQIIVVDTGSTDGTAKLAASLGAEVYYHAWKNDFSQARNHALSYVRSEWIISLDADEALIPGELEKILPVEIDPAIGGFECELINYLDINQSTSVSHFYTRVFRNHPQIKFNGIIHEQIAESITALGLSISKSKIQIEHFGYINSSEEKKLRNKSMLEEQLSNTPSDAWLRYHLANVEFSLLNFKRAKEIYFDIQMSNELSADQQETVQLRLLQIALKHDDFVYSAQHENIRFLESNREGLRLFIMSNYFMSKKEFSKALDSLNHWQVDSSNLIDKTLLEKSRDLLYKIVK